MEYGILLFVKYVEKIILAIKVLVLLSTISQKNMKILAELNMIVFDKEIKYE